MSDKKWFFFESSDNKVEIIFGRLSEISFPSMSSRSIGYNSKEELFSDLGILECPCKECGNLVKTNYREPIKSKLVKSNICFSCLFWTDILEDINNPKRFIVNGAAYYKEADNPNAAFQGFGGSLFKIKRFTSDEVIESRNLWYNGLVPERFKDRIKDNAEFLK